LLATDTVEQDGVGEVQRGDFDLVRTSRVKYESLVEGRSSDRLATESQGVKDGESTRALSLFLLVLLTGRSEL
jgi:hypothetical protein